MMRKAIRSSSMAVPVAILFLMLLQFEAIHSRILESKPTTYIVGDDEGWDLSIDMQSWTRGKNFHAVFNFDDQRFDVAIVNKAGFDSCTVNDGAKVFDSGNETIPLVLGPNYFIDSVADVYAAGLKMVIDATAPPPSF
ncbi:hypothetical protein CRYUN_Cryun10bG0155800 [Craigia yunnanensis]